MRISSFRAPVRRALIVLVSSLVYCLMAGLRAAPPETGNVELKVVKYDELEAVVRAQKGHVVVIDVWADFCVPCKKMLPHLLEMQRKYAADGLVVMTVSVDDPGQREAALKFLQKIKATGPNYLMGEKVEFWQKKWKINGPPASFVFDRDGKRAMRFDSDDPDKPYDHEDVEKVVKDLLRAKP